MPIVLEMPSLSPTMEKGNLVNWCKKEGDPIEIGDILAEIDTDKATMEFESIYDGVLEKIIVLEGTMDVLIKTPIAILRQKDDTDEQIQNLLDSLKSPDESKPKAEIEVVHKIEEVQIQTAQVKAFDKMKASPLAKRIANEYGIDLSKLTGTGPGGRIVKADVLGYSEKAIGRPEIAKEAYIDEPVSNMRRVIAEKLTKSKQETPHFYMNISANVSELLKLRKMINDSGTIGTKITVNDFIIKAVAMAMQDTPEINVSWAEGKIRRYNNIDVSVAVSVDGGLITPIVKNANKKSLKEISFEIKELASKAKAGKLLPEEFLGGSITVSNLGMYNIDSFSSIINPPQGSILSIGPAKKQPIFDDEDNLIPVQIMNIGYAVDHRVIDGVYAAKFLERLKNYLEIPINSLL